MAGDVASPDTVCAMRLHAREGGLLVIYVSVFTRAHTCSDQSPRLEVDRVTHHSILLRWSSPEQAAEVGRLLYTVQQEEEGTGEAREVRSAPPPREMPPESRLAPPFPP